MSNSKIKKLIAGKIAAPVLAFFDSAGKKLRLAKSISRDQASVKMFFYKIKLILFSLGNKKEGNRWARSIEGGNRAAGNFFPPRTKMGTQEQVVFAKRLAILIKSGVSIITALGILEKQAVTGSSRQIIGCLRESVEKGQSLAKAMGNYKNVFGHFGISIVMVGESSGTLAQNLEYMADELKKKQELRRALIGALIYPSFIVVATIGVVAAMTVYVFPKILPIFSSFKAELPWTTKTLIAVSAAVRVYWIYCVLAVFLLAITWRLLLRCVQIKRAADRLLLKLPLLGPMFRSYFIANFSRTFSLLLESDIGIIQTLKIVGETVGNSAYKEAYKNIAAAVIQGRAVSENMENDKLLFPPLVSQMVGVGEMTGSLGPNLMYLSEMYEDEMNNSTKNLTTSIEPALMIFMGILVGFIAISIITPIYGITQNLH